MPHITKRNCFYFLLSICIGLGCALPEKESSPKNKSKVIIREANDAANIFPPAASGSLSYYIDFLLYQPLMNVDYHSGEFVGVIAEDNPEIKTLAGNRMQITFRLREEAKFDNGRSILSEDVLFSLKTYFFPAPFNLDNVGDFGFIDSVITYPDDPRSIAFYTKLSNSRVKYMCSGFLILPHEIIDPNGVLKNYSLEQLRNTESIKEDPKLQVFSAHLSQLFESASNDDLIGSGPYYIKNWEKGQRITLEKKKNWWGNALEAENLFFVTNNDQIQYEIINDQVTALNALKNGEIDLLRGIDPKDFDRIKADKNPNIELKSKPKSGYQFLGFNLNDEILNNREVRHALAMITPTQLIIDNVYYGNATPNPYPYPIAGLQNTSNYGFDPDKATEILNNEGWEDTNADGILDKTVNRKVKSLSFEYLYNTGNKSREAVGNIIKNEAKKIGIEIQLKNLEWSVYLEKLTAGEFDIFFYGATTPPLPPDFRQLFHSKSATNGKNWVNYTNPTADSLILLINQEINDLKRLDQIRAFYELIETDLPYYFMFTPDELMAHSSSLNPFEISSIRPFYWAPELSHKQ